MDLYEAMLTMDERAALARIGRKGGLRTKEKMGLGHYSKIGKLGGAALAEQRGSEYYRKIGRIGHDRRAKNAWMRNKVKRAKDGGVVAGHEGPGEMPIETGEVL